MTAGIRRLLIGSMVLVLAAALASCGTVPEPVQEPVPTAAEAPTLSGSSAWGLTMTADRGLSATIAKDESLLGRQVDVVNSFVSWALQPSTQKLQLDALRSISSPGRTIVITWEPGTSLDSHGVGGGEPLLPRIASGAEDAAATAFLEQLADFPGRVVLRFAHEMNGDWYEWAGAPGVYKAAWARIHALVAASAPKVLMAWSVNNEDQPSGNTLESYWPGDALVDIIGIDGYNCLAGWLSPEEVFQSAYDRVAGLDPRAPIWITETASCEAGAILAQPGSLSKAAWITQLFALTTLPRVAAVVWFDRNNEFDWRIDSTGASVDALRTALAR